MPKEIWLADDAGDNIVDLSELEPWAYTVEGYPLTRIEYGYNYVKIEWATSEELDRTRGWFE